MTTQASSAEYTALPPRPPVWAIAHFAVPKSPLGVYAIWYLADRGSV